MASNKVILAIEDSDEDFEALIRVVREFDINYPIHRLQDGDEALDYLYHQGDYANQSMTPPPAIILMDLNLPGTDGREVIQKLKQDDALKSIPIVVFTTSSSPKDIATCYYYGVNSYMLKQIGVEQLKQTIRDFFQYWFHSAVLPTL